SAAETQPLQEERPETCMAPLPPAAEAADAPASPIAPQETQTATEAARHFEILCPDLLTPDFVASVQRALAARGFFTGPVTGELDPESRAAIAAYQAEQGLESDALSLAAARRLGLVAVERPVDN
ncbi:MAG: peptidoglycan-binding domain-containing protein, partial [Pseudomonadota bacterium]